MKKLLAMVVICAAFASCGGAKTEEVKVDSTTVKVDTTVVKVDSVKVDSTVKVDTAAKK